MAEPRRIQLTPLSSNVQLQLTSGVKPALPTKEVAITAKTVAVTTSSQFSPYKQPGKTERFVLTLFEPDQHRCPEFYYPELVNKKNISENGPSTLEKENQEKDELQAIARALEEKYGGVNKRKKDRVQDLVDIGEGYDNEDSFIDNSEAYDELVPASLTTKLGGFYVNSGPLQFRQASDTETDNDFMDKSQPFKSLKKRKLMDGAGRPKKKAKQQEETETYMLPNADVHPDDYKPKKLKRKKPPGPLSVTDMLRKFQKQKDKEKLKREKERQQKLTLENIKGGSPVAGNMADPLLSLIGSTNDRAFLQAASTVDFDLDLDTLLDASTEPLANQASFAMTVANQEANIKTLSELEVHGLEEHCVDACGDPSAFSLENDTQKPNAHIVPIPKPQPQPECLLQTQPNIDPVPQTEHQIGLVPESTSKPQVPKHLTQSQPAFGLKQPPALLPEGLSPALEKRIQELFLVAKGLEGESKVKFFNPEVNTILLDIELRCREVSGQVRSKVYTHLASFLPCSRETLLKRVKKLLLSQEKPIQRLREAIERAMPEQISRYFNDCQAHADAKVAKIAVESKEREHKEMARSEEEGEREEKCVRRALGPRKKFQWTEEIRECLCTVIRVWMDTFEVEKGKPEEAEEFLKTFLDKEVKPLWPKGWMQPRVLLKESRRIHSSTATVQQANRKVKSEKKQSSLDGALTPPGTSSVPVEPQSFLRAQLQNEFPLSDAVVSMSAPQHLDDSPEHGVLFKPLSLGAVGEELAGLRGEIKGVASSNAEAQSANVNTPNDSPLNVLADQALAQGQLPRNYIHQGHLMASSDFEIQSINSPSLPPAKKKKKQVSEVSAVSAVFSPSPGPKRTLGNKTGLPGIPLLQALGFPISALGPGLLTKQQHSKETPMAAN
ncbi:hypothetical protein UPYG_G00235370 [Umbra pygmaea]|uniref:Ubinuclein-1 n=1 Tax=Umbra pygmaea TaxID=75934 RepID=A0ABD0X219_UMBPY